MKETTYEYIENWFHTPSPLEKEGGIWLYSHRKESSKTQLFYRPKIYYLLQFTYGPKRFWSV